MLNAYGVDPRSHPLLTNQNPIGKPIVSGDGAKCSKCGYERTLTSELLQELIGKFYPERPEGNLYQSDLSRFRCSQCGERGANLVRKPKPMKTPRTKYRSETDAPLSNSAKWDFCNQCGGDGGAGGNCPRCGGNGFEPSDTE